MNKGAWKWVMGVLKKKKKRFMGKQTWNGHWKHCHWVSILNREEKLLNFQCSVFRNSC